ncbi:MAG TPA: hypothetical protein VFO34_15275 [Candidatus Acidoferrales bacterium]|nr:hypothetical protein [Candidatus Acidoferrales bacterium]
MTRFVRCMLVNLAILATVTSLPVCATSIVIDYKPDRVFLLADSRAVDTDQDGSSRIRDKCKIAVLSDRFAFAETGREGYTPNSPIDPVQKWNGIEEALSAYRQHLNADIRDIALSWGRSLAADFQSFYLVNPERVRSLTVANGTLLVGLFVGADASRKIRVYRVRIAIDDSLRQREGAVIPVGYAVDALPPTSRPYFTDGITQELFEGKTERARTIGKEWSQRGQRMRLIDAQAFDLVHLEFLIEETGKFDDSVHGPVNILSVSKRSVTWIQNKTCR